MAQLSMKLPCLNNMAQCLIRQKQYSRAIEMLDQVLQLDEKNAKATARKLNCLLELGHHDQAEKVLSYTANTIDSFNTSPTQDIQLLRQTLQSARKQIVDKRLEDKKFMQNVFKKSSLYEDKEDVKTPEELAKEDAER